MATNAHCDTRRRRKVKRKCAHTHTRVQTRKCSKRDAFTHTIAQVGDYLLEYRENRGPEISEVPNLPKNPVSSGCTGWIRKEKSAAYQFTHSLQPFIECGGISDMREDFTRQHEPYVQVTVKRC